MLIVRIETSSDALSDVTIVLTILLHKALHHSWLQELSHIVIIADTHAVCLLLQLILHTMAIPLRFDTLLSILHSIIRQRSHYLVGNVHGRTVRISAQSRLHHLHCLLIAVGSTISQQVCNHVLKVSTLLIRSLLPVLQIVGKLGIHQAFIIHNTSRNCNRSFFLRFRRSLLLCLLLYLLIIVLWLLCLLLLVILTKKHIGYHSTHLLLLADISGIHLWHHAECLRNDTRLI